MRQEGKETMRVVEIETQERERCYVVIDEVGIEARPDQRDTITPRQRSRIQGFVTLVDKIFSSQEELDAGKQPEIKIYTANGVFTGFIPITQPMVDTWMNIALDLAEIASFIPRSFKAGDERRVPCLGLGMGVPVGEHPLVPAS
jgi:hypothetical protein